MTTAMKRKRKPLPTIAVIGMGNWGTSLAHALDAAGLPVEERVIPAGRRRTAAMTVPFDKARLTADILWLCVPDAAITGVARQLAQRMRQTNSQRKPQIVVHSSGALSASVLQAAANVGASVASVHPLMSFPTRTPVSLQGVPFGVEADAATRRILSAVIHQMGGQPFAIDTSGSAASKALYHAAAMLASPLLVSHLVAAQQVAERAGFSPRQARQLIAPIARATLDNVFSKGAQKSFSGPIARGDIETIRLHLQALEPHPMLGHIYRSLAVYAVHALPAAGSKRVARLLGTKVPPA